jgi:hypothetical protein
MAVLTIGEIRDEDVEDVVRLWERCGLIRPWNDPRSDIARARLGTASAVLVGRRDGLIAATVMVGHDGHRGWVYYVAVEPSLQKSGCGRAIMEASEAWLRQQGIPKMQLLVRAGNASAMGFYEALGFSAQDVTVHAKWIDGRKN